MVARSLEVAADGLRRAAGPYALGNPNYLTCWWEWVTGSSPFFWTWPERYVNEVCAGQKHFLVGEFTAFRRPQLPSRTEEEGEQVRAKLVQVWRREYIEYGPVDSLTHYFPVEKGPYDIRMVYDGTSSGLNVGVWAPHFGLPYVSHTVRSLMPGYCQCDLDVGEMFLNFLLHEELKRLSGVDVQHGRSTDPADAEWERERGDRWERWCRNWMGLTDSPYRSIQWLLRLKMEACGDHTCHANPFHWDRVVLNLPGTRDYRPDLPWVMKLRWDGHLATEVFVYCDDGRCVGFCREICWAAARRLASVEASYGIQDRAAKRTFPSPTPGPWAGTVSHTDRHEVAGLMSEEKWDKTRSLILELVELIGTVSNPAARVPRQRLLEIRGFLNYVVRTYPWLNPYLKGLHLTIDGWREGREEGGWKATGPPSMASRRAREDELGRRSGGAPVKADQGPEHVLPQPRLHRDVKCLIELTALAEPPRHLFRVGALMAAFYVPGDASGSGFGSAVIGDHGIEYQSGTWSGDWRTESSNFREADNLVRRLEAMVASGRAAGQQVFLFTDNLVFESCFYKGHSVSEKLSDIIFRLHKAQRDGGLQLHVIHVAGTRMKEWGVDGLSRGDLMEGMMAGKDALSFIPLAKGANKRSGGAVRGWVDSWWGDWCGEPLTEVDKDRWFILNKVLGPRSWMPPPGRHGNGHGGFQRGPGGAPLEPPRVCCASSDDAPVAEESAQGRGCAIHCLSGRPFLGPSRGRPQHEPLIIAVVLPLSHTPSYRGPWLARGSAQACKLACELDAGFKHARNPDHKGLLELGRSLGGLWQDPAGRSRDLLQEFLRWARGFPPVHECVVRGLLQGVPDRPFSEDGAEQRRGRKRSSLGGQGRREVSGGAQRRPPSRGPL